MTILRAKCLAAAWCLALAVMAAGCAAPMAQVGDNPVRLTVPYDQKITDQQIQRALYETGPAARGSQLRFDNYLGPFWEMKAFLVSPDGKEDRLPPAPGQSEQLGDGKAVSGRITFLAPPGKQRIKLVLIGQINRSWQQRPGGNRNYQLRTPDGRTVDDVEPGWQTQFEYITVLEKVRKEQIEARPGAELELPRLFAK